MATDGFPAASAGPGPARPEEREEAFALLFRHCPAEERRPRVARALGLIAKGADAVEGAAQVHTDLARGFVRAEVVTFDDFRRVGSMKEAKAHGVYRLEGKTYVVKDGDIMHILAST